MASPILTGAVEPPRKRQRLSPPLQSQSQPQLQSSTINPSEKTTTTAATTAIMEARVPVTDTGFQPGREAAVGIREFVNASNPGFSGTLKQRYTDFIVNEILPDGTVAHLTDDRAPRVTAEQAGLGSAPANASTSQDATLDSQKGGAKPSRIPQIKYSDVRLEEAEHVSSKDVKAEALPLAESSEFPTKAQEDTKPNRIPPMKYSDVRLEEAANALASDAQSAPIKSEDAETHVKSENGPTAGFVLVPEDEEILIKLFGAAVKDQIIEFHQKIMAKRNAKSGTFGSIESEPVADKSTRGNMHKEIRRIFSSRLDTAFIEESGKIKFTAGPLRARQSQGGKSQANSNPNPRQQNDQSRGKLSWDMLGGEHLHFSLYKVNKDTMEVISFLAKELHVQPRQFSFAGTKDRRAATVQRVSIYRKRAYELAGVNHRLISARIGNFKHEKHRLELGELGGNEFHITLRDCHFGADSSLDDAARLQHANSVVGAAIEHLQHHGFINYFGMQRFGSFAIGTNVIGKLILQGKFEEAVEAILSFDESLVSADQQSAPKVARDDIARAQAINLFNTGHGGDAALYKLPRKFAAEQAIIRHLSRKNTSSDFIGAIQQINRNLKTMYVHAYQSLVWNLAASKRWSKYGSKVIEGDLVLVDTHAAKALAKDDVDENGEVVVHPADDDAAITHDDIYERAHALSAEEADSGKYTIFDVVLPTPGFDIEYPSNDIGDFYKEFMSSEEGGYLDPADMRRKQKDFSLSGSYRKLLGQVGKDLSFDIKAYYDENEQLVKTDLEKLEESRPKSAYITGMQNGRFQSDARSNRGGLGGRFDNDRGGNQPQADPSETNRGGSPKIPVTPQLSPEERASRINAWKNLPEKLAAEDKAAAVAYDLEKANRKPLDPSVIHTPAIHDTWIQTSAENEGRRTGFRSKVTHGKESPETVSKTVIGSDTKDVSLVVEEVEVDSKISTPKLEGTTTAMEAGVDSTVPPNPIAEQTSSVPEVHNSELSVSMSTDSDGGVSLAVHPQLPADKTVEMTNAEPELKRSADQMSAGTSEDNGPARIAVVVKFALGSSQYATMALRELMKAGGVKDYKPAFSR